MRQPKTETVTHKKQLWVTVSEATVAIGIKRQNLLRQARAEAPASFDEQLLRLLVYPDLIAATVDARGFDDWPISFDDYLALPEQFAYEWERAVYALNPHWIPEKKKPEVADDLYRRLTELANERRLEQDTTPELPDDLILVDVDNSYRLWQLMEATGWRFLPSQLMNEPEWLMNDLLTIAGAAGKIEKMVNSQ